MSRRLFWVPLALSIALAARASTASPLFPGTVATTLKLDIGTAPSCPLCHTTIEGEKGTATKPFARTLIGYGLMPTDTPTLTSILTQMKEKGTDDSDGDGVGDIAEIEQGRDPNVNDITGKPPDDYPPPSYGCAVRASSTIGAGRTGPLVLALFAGLGLARAVRRRARKTARTPGARSLRP